MDGRLTPYHRRDQAYDAAVSEACHRTDTPPETPENAVMGVTTSAIATDVLSLFDAETGAASTAGSGAAARRTFGANMRLILVFETADAPPVADLIDLDQGILVDSYSTDDHQPVHHPLVSIADLAGEARPYLLVPSGKPSQSDREITLPWDFGFSDLRADEPFHLPYKAGFDYFRVTRTNLSRPDDKPKVVNLTPCWLDRGPRAALAGEPQFVRPKFQFVDKDFPADGIGAVREGDKLQYLVEAFGEINPAQPLAKCLFEIDRQTFEALSAPGPLLALHAAEAVERPTGSGRYLLGGNVELAVGVARESDLANLKLRYRLRSIRAIGPYGAETDPGVATRPRAGLPDHARVLPASTPPRPGSPPPAPRLIPDVRFSESPLSRGIPWEETTGLETQGADVAGARRCRATPPNRARRRTPRPGPGRRHHSRNHSTTLAIARSSRFPRSSRPSKNSAGPACRRGMRSRSGRVLRYFRPRRTSRLGARRWSWPGTPYSPRRSRSPN